MAKMIRKLFNGLAFFAFVSLAYFVVALFQTKDNTSFLFTRQYPMENENITLLDIKWLEELVHKTKASNASRADAEVPTTTSKALGPCPNTPPKLVGPLHIEFNSERSLDEVRKEAGSALKQGGRFKPLDCIAKQKVAIIIAFRNRYEHLTHWLYYLHPILMRQQLDYTVYVINQYGEGVFNRAKLMNVGYVEALKEYDYDCFVFSDVDLIPMDDRNLYRCFDNPRHLSVATDKFNFRLPYKTNFGGVCSLSKEQFFKINGFPNTYWGWGAEDDDIYRRITYNGMSISRPDSVQGKYRMIRHQRDLHNEVNPHNPYKQNFAVLAMRIDGINSLRYTVKLIVRDILFTFITVDIEAPLKI